eukprot:TRINITY_DN18692_c0_g1_i5.p1 TRINITY_DN18692_c0_g1~~TRINITY_DN18692_c0_g1_i5.p1  ORF type:complete len:827 (+),score=191.29 TRINITY_DN18692_c0_g1_i5:304-2784(+)
MEGNSTAAIFDSRAFSKTIGREKGTRDTFPSHEWPNQALTTVGDFWNWFQYDLCPSFFMQDWYSTYQSDGTEGAAVDFESSDTLGRLHLGRYNLVVGAMRLVQQRVIKNDCSIPSRSYRSGDICYPAYAASTKSEEAFNGHTFDADTHTQVWFSMLQGNFRDYKGEGFVKDFRPNQTVEEYTGELLTLKDDLFIDYQSRTLTITLNTYTAGLDMWVQNVFFFEWPGSGAMYYSASARSFTASVPAKELIMMAILTWGSIHYIVNAIFLTVREGLLYVSFKEWSAEERVRRKKEKEDARRKAGKKRKRKRKSTRAMSTSSAWAQRLWWFSAQSWRSWTMWRTLDLSQAAFVVAWVVTRIWFVYEVDSFNPDMATDEFVDLDQISAIQTLSFSLQGPVAFLALCKLMKFMGMNPRLTIVSRAFGFATQPIVAFMLPFFVVFVAFMFWAHLAFRSQISHFATVVDAINETVDYFVGNVNLNFLYAANPWMGPLYGAMFIVIMTIALANMFIAIINLGYSEAMDEFHAPVPFVGFRRTIDGEQFKQAILSVVSYAQKFFYVMTFQLCFKSRKGLPVTLEDWEAMTISERLPMVLKANAVWLCKTIAFLPPPVVANQPSFESRIFQKYYGLVPALRRLRKVYNRKGDVEVFVSREAVEALVGDIDRFDSMYDKWNGPVEQRTKPNTSLVIMRDSFARISHGVRCIRKTIATRRATAKRNEFESGRLPVHKLWHAGLSPYRLLEEQRADQLDLRPTPGYVAEVSDFPEFLLVRNIIINTTWFSRDAPTIFSWVDESETVRVTTDADHGGRAAEDEKTATVGIVGGRASSTNW